MFECPRCHGQGIVEPFFVKLTGEEIYLCDECDALWRDCEEITVANCKDFSTYVAHLGLKGTWDEIAPLTRHPRSGDTT